MTSCIHTEIMPSLNLEKSVIYERRAWGTVLIIAPIKAIHIIKTIIDTIKIDIS